MDKSKNTSKVSPTELKKNDSGKKIHFKPFSQVTPLICAFCGGKGCKHENWLTNPNSAIKGLNSDWITDNILATQRPSSRLIKEFNVIQQFKAKGINAILNLQEPGEHPHCGDGILAQSGFSYLPEDFYNEGIYFFNFGWRDMTATSTDLILKILKQMSFILMNGEKIAVHCHAGRGRTGLVIAAWLIYNEGMTAKEAIKLMRAKRKESISKKSQEVVLFELEKLIKSLRLVFYSSPKMGLEQYMHNQKLIMPLSTASEERYVPKIVLVALERIETLLSSNICNAKQVVNAFVNLNDDCFAEKWEAKHEKFLKTFKDQINVGNYQTSEIDDPRYLVQILLDFLDHFTVPATGPNFVNTIIRDFSDNTPLTEASKEKLFKSVDKKELFLVESFVRLFSELVEYDKSVAQLVQQAITRLCISLVLTRNKHDKSFLKRNLIQPNIEDERIEKLRMFIYKWIEHFNEDLNVNYLMGGSPNSLANSKVPGYDRAKTLLSRALTKLSEANMELAKVGISLERTKKKSPTVVKMAPKSHANLDSHTKGLNTEEDEEEELDTMVKNNSIDLQSSDLSPASAKNRVASRFGTFTNGNPKVESTYTKNRTITEEPVSGEIGAIKIHKVGDMLSDYSVTTSNESPEMKKAKLNNSDINGKFISLSPDLSGTKGKAMSKSFTEKSINPLQITVLSPHASDLVSKIELLDENDQDALLEKLMSLQMARRKASPQ